MEKPQIISSNTCSKLFSSIVITDIQRKAQEKWLNLLENGKLEKEEENYPVFMNTILRDLLGFPEELIEKAYEQKNVEFAFKDPQGMWSVLFEAKGHSQKKLDANQGRNNINQRTPLMQTFDNLGRFEFIKYGVCTNYQTFVLMDYNLKFSALQEFDFESTKNNDEKLKEFIGIFSYKTLVINKDILKFKSVSDNADKELTTEFYKLFHETRLMLIKAFKEKQHVSNNEAIYFAQMFLKRILFLFFALDNGLIDDSELFKNRLFGQLKLKQCTENSKKIFDDIMLLFEALDKGSKFLHIDGFGGELFSGKIPEKIYFLDFQSKLFFASEIMHSKLSKELKFHGDSFEIWKEFGDNVSPIIKNLLIMDSRDFSSEINVTILGHILEQSLDDLTQFQKTGDIKRKIDGVYYTPPNLTDYVCRNTIIPYLSKNNINNVRELINEYRDEIGQLEDKLQKIRIIDPACGSGAFLINAAKILLEIAEQIEIIKKGETTQVISGTLDEWQKEKEVSKIITNNIFGIDINRESVEITKLSLFLMMAKPGETLANLSNNILNRNSLVDDVDVDSYAMTWEKEFPEIMTSGGFNVIIGNPPWQIIKPDVDEFFSPLKEMKLLLTIHFPKKPTTFSMLSAPQKKQLMTECLKQNNISQKYREYRDYYAKLSKYYISSHQYEFQGDGDLNLYKLFVERSVKILQNNGIFGMVMPSGIYTDLGGKQLRENMFESNTILELCGFVNRKPIFEDVHRQFRFCTLILKKGGNTKKFLTRFSVLDDDDCRNFRKEAFEYDLKLVKITSPDNLTILECTDKIEFQIFDKLFKFPLLGSDTWTIKATRELDMTLDADLFHTANVGPPLFEGKMMHMFTDNFNGRVAQKYWVDKEDVEKRLERKEFNRLPKSFLRSNSQFKLKLHAHEYRLVYRKLSNATNERTLISTILPPNIFLGENLHYIRPINFDGKKYVRAISHVETFYLCGMFNSFTVDFVMRHRISTNINYFHMSGLPIPRFDKNNYLHQKIFKNSAMLICTTNEFTVLRDKVDVSEFVTDPERRIALEAQINACSAKIYGLTREELEYVLEIFPIVKKELKDLTLDEFSLL